MRKQLMAGTALVAATMLAGGALAADKKMMKLSISVNGYHEQMLSAVLEDDLNTHSGRSRPGRQETQRGER